MNESRRTDNRTRTVEAPLLADAWAILPFSGSPGCPRTHSSASPPGPGAAFARRRSTPLVFACGVAGLALGPFTEWPFAPFIVDKSFLYFITHIHHLKPITLLLLVLGTFGVSPRF